MHEPLLFPHSQPTSQFDLHGSNRKTPTHVNDFTDHKPQLDLMDEIMTMDGMDGEVHSTLKQLGAGITSTGGQRQPQLRGIEEAAAGGGGLAEIFSFTGGIGGGLLPFCSDDDSTAGSSSMCVSNNDISGNGAMSCWTNSCRGTDSPVTIEEVSSDNCNLFGWSALTTPSQQQNSRSGSSSKTPNSTNNGTTFLQTSSHPINVSSSRGGGSSSPNTKNPTEATDKLLSAELKRLTVVEREKVTEDIHGIAEVIDEDIDFVRQKIQQYDEEITKLRKRHARIATSNYAAAYEKALFINPQLVQHDIDFKLMFLRGDNFDPEKAANRLMMYFTTKLELFGLDKLTKQPITLDDLNEEDKSHLYGGGVQPLPLKDRAGRRVLAVFPKHQPLGQSPSSFRAMWYIMMAMIENDVEVQRRGTVDVFYFIGGTTSLIPQPNSNNIEMPKKFHQSLPRRVVAMHALYCDPMMGPLMMIAPLVVSKFKLVRFRSHYGSPMEGTYALNSFGIPAEHLPIDQATGEDLDNRWFHNEYLANRKEFDDQLAELRANGEDSRIVPSSRDVLLGRGRPFQFHEGNLRLSAMIDQHRARYTEAGSTYGKKNVICEEIVDLIHESGGRFLKHKNSNNPMDGWELVGADIAREKVSHSFRTTKRTKRSNSSA